MKRGDQIVYVPAHADGNVLHPDCEFGFIAYMGIEYAFCRFWRKGQPGILRTTANSEGAALRDLLPFHSVRQKIVNSLLDQFDKEKA